MSVEIEVHMQLEGQEGFPAAIQTLDLLNTELCLFTAWAKNFAHAYVL